MPHENPAIARLARRPVRTRPVSIDVRIAGIARRQHGVITRQQLLGEVELRAGAIHRRLAAGRLVAVHRGVYRVAGPPAPLGWAMAAAVAGGEGAVVSGASAAAVHAIGRRGPRVEITGPRERRHPGIHSRVARLSTDDVTVHLGVPVTTVARTVFDVAGRADYSSTRLVELLHRARIVRPGVLADLALLIARESGPGRNRLAEMRLRPHLADDSGPIRSVFEQQFRQAVAESDLPAPHFNVIVGGMEVDVIWPTAGLVVELDGYAYHSDAAAFERDRERDAQLGALHHQVIRITWRRWRDRPEVELQRLREIILARSVWRP